uniref:Arf-GAP domain-containing protein n=1 Tax=Kalanchoe fedtschenkoi TaxID=63787 RepID=A0A7N0VIX8_KALFE
MDLIRQTGSTRTEKEEERRRGAGTWPFMSECIIIIYRIGSVLSSVHYYLCFAVSAYFPALMSASMDLASNQCDEDDDDDGEIKLSFQTKANALMEAQRNERVIRDLMKLPENRKCINCNSLHAGTPICCTTFCTFVCLTCRGIHRDFTHRAKLVSVAKFTYEEATALWGGGN